MLQDSSIAFNNVRANSQWKKDPGSRGNRYKFVPNLPVSIVLKELQIKVRPGMLFAGVTFDPMYIGRV
jgi:hypothetical protein